MLMFDYDLRIEHSIVANTLQGMFGHHRITLHARHLRRQVD